MKLFQKILCAVDFSEASQQAFQYAKAIAESFGSKLVLLHVSPNPSEAYAALMPDFPTYGLQKEEDILEQFNEFTSDWSGKLQKVIRVGIPYIEILDYAKGGKFDLIIAGAKGHSTFERLFLGSTTEKITRKAESAVLTVHGKSHGLPFKKILLPIDFSPLSYAALPMVAAIAEKFRAEIYLLHVVESGKHLDPKQQAKEYELFERLKDRLSEEWQLPQEFAHIETKKFVRHHLGSPGYGILEFAQDWDIDLITMATHGRSGLSRVMLGSVTEKVLKISPCPVLSIRSQFTNTKRIF